MASLATNSLKAARHDQCLKREPHLRQRRVCECCLDALGSPEAVGLLGHQEQDLLRVQLDGGLARGSVRRGFRS
ncbi:hypothetical protein AF335_05075 [Streptomyces eurocidicus]|uniref:Uncharacterized protein n=1 Tax=Streptomyces eurocidicus TaxID=66423 RepID=A0A2N8NZ70_STREU|nr:hypothetical protein AF335_05075 [Streptomyces eurocidicus]